MAVDLQATTAAAHVQIDRPGVRTDKRFERPGCQRRVDLFEPVYAFSLSTFIYFVVVPFLQLPDNAFYLAGITILLVEQEVSTVFKMASRNYVLSSGKIIAEGIGDELLQDEILRKTYLGL